MKFYFIQKLLVIDYRFNRYLIDVIKCFIGMFDENK